MPAAAAAPVPAGDGAAKAWAVAQQRASSAGADRKSATAIAGAKGTGSGTTAVAAASGFSPLLARMDAPVQIGGASSAAGGAFVATAGRSLARPGGYGEPHLTELWSRIANPAERSAIARSLDAALAERMTQLGRDGVAAVGSGHPGALRRMQAHVASVRDLEAAAALPRHELPADARAQIRQALLERVQLLEREVTGAAAGTQLAASIEERIGGLTRLLPIVEDQQLEQRLATVYRLAQGPRTGK